MWVEDYWDCADDKVNTRVMAMRIRVFSSCVCLGHLNRKKETLQENS